jgi:hypothetical protein
MEFATSYFVGHRRIFDRFGLSYDRGEERVVCRFTEAQARAFMLLHVFMHELGHPYDRMQQKHLNPTRGEDHTERFASSRFDQLLPMYERVFGHPNGAASDSCY